MNGSPMIWPLGLCGEVLYGIVYRLGRMVKDLCNRSFTNGEICLGVVNHSEGMF